MKIKSLLSLILLAATLISLIACKPTSPDEPPIHDCQTTVELPESETPEATEPETTKGEDPNRKITLFDNKKWEFRLVTRSQRSKAEVEFSFALSGVMSALTGVTPHTANDTSIKPDEEYEILIGYTAHPVMQSLYYGLCYGEARAKVIGNKILLASYSAEGYTKLLEYMKGLLTAAYTGTKIELTVADVDETIVTNEALGKIPGVSMAGFSSIEDCGLDQTLVIHKDATEQIFREYIKKYSAYKCVSEVYEAGNCFATFDVGSDLINVSFSNGDKCLRIIHNKNTEPTELFNQPSEVKKVCEPMIIMHGLAWKKSGYTTHQNGLCLIIRLSDGTFVIVDGGFNRDKDADDLYKLLKDNTPDGMETTVAAWFITHAHGDHHATFASEFPKYRTKVNVKNVFFNPPLGGVYSSEKNEGTGWSTIVSTVPAYKAKLIRPHVGDRYYVGDAVIDMLYTVDYQYPNVFSYYNTSSIIFSLKIAGQRIMITGDGANSSFDKMVAMYGESLKADIVQVAHHGYGTGANANASTGVVQGYKYMSPSLVLWPIGPSGYNSVQNAVYNVALKTLPSVKKIIVAEDKDHIVMLPFKAS